MLYAARKQHQRTNPLHLLTSYFILVDNGLCCDISLKENYQDYVLNLFVAFQVNWLSHLAEDYQTKRAALRKPDPNARSALVSLALAFKVCITLGLVQSVAFML